jgi:hypothetical protein
VASFKFRRVVAEPAGHAGHSTKTVRDRQAPGSNPGPPTNFEFKIADFGRRRKTQGHSRVTDFLGTRPRQTPFSGLRTVH